LFYAIGVRLESGVDIPSRYGEKKPQDFDKSQKAIYCHPGLNAAQMHLLKH